MKKQFRKIIAILCTIAMLLSLASAFAEEANAAPATETANAAVELPSGETPSAQEDVPAAGEASDDEGTAPRQEAPETDGTASGQDAPKAGEAPTADAASAGQDVPETQDASEDAATDNKEEIPQDDGEVSDSEEDSEDDFEDDGEYEIIDSFGLVDDNVIDELTPEMTDEFKGFRYAQLSVEKPLEDTIEFDQEMVITLAPAEGDLLLKLYATPGVRFSMKVDSKAASLVREKSDDFSRELYVYELAASASSHEIVLTSDDTLAFRLAVEKKAAEQKAEEEAAADEPAEVAAAATEPAGETAAATEPAEETAAGVPAEETAATKPAEEAAESEPAEEAAASEPAGEAAADEPDPENEAPAADSREEKPEQPTDKEYDTMKVGGEISDTLAAGQKAVILLKCGKNPIVNLTLKADNDPAVRIDGSEVQFTQTGEGTYTALLENVAFRKFTITVTAAQETGFAISAAAGVETEKASEGLSDKAMLAKGYIKAFVAIDIGARIYATRDSMSAAGHLKAGTEVWVKLIDGADRAEIYNPDETAFARYINLVDIIATLKPEGMEALPTRELVLTSSLDGQEQVYYGTEVTLNATLVNFQEDDIYSVEWMYTVPGTGSDHVVIEGADQLTFTYTLTEENARNTWTILVTLISGQE